MSTQYPIELILTERDRQFLMDRLDDNAELVAAVAAATAGNRGTTGFWQDHADVMAERLHDESGRVVVDNKYDQALVIAALQNSTVMARAAEQYRSNDLSHEQYMSLGYGAASLRRKLATAFGVPIEPRFKSEQWIGGAA